MYKKWVMLYLNNMTTTHAIQRMIGLRQVEQYVKQYWEVTYR